MKTREIGEMYLEIILLRMQDIDGLYQTES